MCWLFVFKFFVSNSISFWSDDSDIDDDDNEVNLTHAAYKSWYYHSDQLEHENATTAWPLIDTWSLCWHIEQLTGKICKKIEFIIVKLYTPCPNHNIFDF